MLTGAQVSELAKEIDEQWTAEQFGMFLRDELDIDVSKLAGRNVKERVVELIKELTRPIPTRDGELLEKLEAVGNRRLKNVASTLLRPEYFSPTSDPHDAILLGEEAFVDRGELRRKLRTFTNPSRYTTRVLIIRGDEPCGKSYSWSFLRHLASTSSVGAKAVHVPLRGTGYTPGELFEYLFRRLGLSVDVLPPMRDNPQHARVNPLLGAFMSQVDKLQQRYWLVIDDINDPDVTPEIRETVYAIASHVEDDLSENLWIALLGYNQRISDPRLQRAAQDDAQFPDAELLAQHFKLIADHGGKPLPVEEARAYARLVLADFPVLNKEAMTELTPIIERMGRKLRAGERPRASERL